MASRIYKSIITNTLLWKCAINKHSAFLIPCQVQCGKYISEIFKIQHNRFHTTNSLEATTEVKMPSLSPTMTEGTIVKWAKNEGDVVTAGDVLCEIQTDKAVVALEIDEDGILAKILMPENAADIKVGTLIALVVGEGEDWKNVEVPSGSSPVDIITTEKSEQSSISKPSSADGGASSDGDGSSLLGPAVKTLLTHYGINRSQLVPSGPHGVILKGDVLLHVSSKNLKPLKHEVELPKSGRATKSPKGATAKQQQSVVSFQEIEVTNMRRTIAKRLLQSKSTIPHAYGVAECRIDNLTRLRKELKSIGIKVSVNDFIIKVVANTLSKSPAINVVWEGSELVQKGTVDISVAVATDNGLITPIVTNVQERDVIQIAEQVKALAEKARSGKLQPHEFMGGSFSISNLGMFGIHHFSAIINPPQCAILAVGGGHVSLDKNGKPATTVGFTLSYDASAISEEATAKFLANLKHEVENVSEISIGIYNLESRVEMIELSSAL